MMVEAEELEPERLALPVAKAAAALEPTALASEAPGSASSSSSLEPEPPDARADDCARSEIPSNAQLHRRPNWPTPSLCQSPRLWRRVRQALCCRSSVLWLTRKCGRPTKPLPSGISDVAASTIRVPPSLSRQPVRYLTLNHNPVLPALPLVRQRTVRKTTGTRTYGLTRISTHVRLPRRDDKQWLPAAGFPDFDSAATLLRLQTGTARGDCGTAATAALNWRIPPVSRRLRSFPTRGHGPPVLRSTPRRGTLCRGTPCRREVQHRHGRHSILLRHPRQLERWRAASGRGSFATTRAATFATGFTIPAAGSFGGIGHCGWRALDPLIVSRCRRRSLSAAAASASRAFTSAWFTMTSTCSSVRPPISINASGSITDRSSYDKKPSPTSFSAKASSGVLQRTSSSETGAARSAQSSPSAGHDFDVPAAKLAGQTHILLRGDANSQRQL